MKSFLRRIATLLVAIPLLATSCSEDLVSDITTARPTAKVAATSTTRTSLTFTVAIEGCDRAAYRCLPKEEAKDTDLYAYEIITKGKAVAESGQFTVEGLEPQSDYIIAVASAKGNIYSSVAQITVTTGALQPTLEVTPGEISFDRITFSVSSENAQQVAYACLEEGVEIPAAAEIIATGTPIDEGAGTVTVQNLYAGNTYTIAVVAFNRGLYSEVKSFSKALPAPFTLSTSDLTYRTGTMSATPTDPTMKYHLSVLERSRFDSYADDNAVFEEYEKGYFKAAYGKRWYMGMEAAAKVGNASYSYRMLKPETEYVLYAYGIEAMVAEKDIAMVTPMIKKIFRTPAWKPTDDCTFSFEVVSNTTELLDIKVTPSKDDVRYFFNVAEVGQLVDNYGSDLDGFTRDFLSSVEVQLGEDIWASGSLLRQGVSNFSMSGEELQQKITPGGRYMIFAFAVDDKGYQTTATKTSAFTAAYEAITPTPVTATELVGGWEAEGYRWDPTGSNALYLLDGGDFAYDDDGNYITCTLNEYLQKYSDDWNANPENACNPSIPEDFADHNFEGSYMFSNFGITETEVTVWQGQAIPGAGTMAVCCVKGTYTYDEATQTMTVNDVAIESEPRTLKIQVSRDTRGRMNFRYADFELYTTYSYDQTQEWYVYAPSFYYCVPGEPYIPDTPANSSASTAAKQKRTKALQLLARGL